MAVPAFFCRRAIALTQKDSLSFRTGCLHNLLQMQLDRFHRKPFEPMLPSFDNAA